MEAAVEAAAAEETDSGLPAAQTDIQGPRRRPVSTKHDTAATPFHRATDHPTMAVEHIVALTRTYSLINPAATQRQIQALTTQLFTMTTSKAGPTQSPSSQARTFT